MGRSRILILGFAAGSAVLAAMLARGFLSPPPPERQVVEVSKVATGDVLVAAADLPLGDKLTPANVAWHRWPKDAITPQMITREVKPNAPPSSRTPGCAPRSSRASRSANASS